MIVPGEGAKVRGSSALMRHSMAWPSKRHVVLREGQAAAGGDADLLVHEVDAGDRLGHRMLDLQAGVHLDEVELAVLVEELDRAGAGIAELGDGLGARSPPILRALLGVEGRRGGFLPDLLVAALQRAVALAEMDGVARPSPNTWTSMWRGLLEIFLDVDGVVAEGGLASVRAVAKASTGRPRCAPPSCRGRRRRPSP